MGSTTFKHSDTKWDLKNIVDQILGGRLLRPPLNPPLETSPVRNVRVNCTENLQGILAATGSP